ncbi:MAG TPA: DUF1292 domain-containing protein [Lachnospiraceae bacterium]|jgi:uncharacterized protein YrzB (UPF0473 family)|nr:DUF1292 domain-containing protein [Lachnospiraceae bacterium]HEX3077872.1 DUF1292 domain-containing protein [Lachnospiraceae bacterium]
MSEKHEHDVDCDCGSDCACNENDGEHMVTLTLDDGTEVECVVLTIFPVGDKDYIALLPVEEAESDEEGEVFLYRFNQLENDEIELLNIEDDEEYEAVADAFDQFLDDQEFQDIIDEEE